MASRVFSVADPAGIDAGIVNVECHITNGLPAVVIIGYASKAVDEAKDRLRASFGNSNIEFPKKRITINLSPADVPKDSTSLDMAMAVSIMAESGLVKLESIQNTIFLGELGLDGSLLPVRGLVGRILAAKKSGYKMFVLPYSSLPQAKLIPEIQVMGARNLRDIFLELSGTLNIKKINTGEGSFKNSAQTGEHLDFSEIAGQEIAKRALEIAAAGHHNILMHGPPGTGKTMLAKALCGILPDLKHSEVLEVTHLHSLGSGLTSIATERPFRSPHHTSSTIALIGGGAKPKPGEASLAHRGVLFLDELPEFSHSALEALRQPLEDRFVTVSRVKDTATYPADFILVGTQNPCPCGYYGTGKECICSGAAIAKYQKRVSGPILDRIDLHISVNDIDHSVILNKDNRPQQSPSVKHRVDDAFEKQIRRFGTARFNSSMNNKEIRELSNLTDESKMLLDQAAAKLRLSARVYIRSVKVARTIADLDNSEDILPKHIAEALQYRQHIFA